MFKLPWFEKSISGDRSRVEDLDRLAKKIDSLAIKLEKLILELPAEFLEMPVLRAEAIMRIRAERNLIQNEDSSKRGKMSAVWRMVKTIRGVFTQYVEDDKVQCARIGNLCERFEEYLESSTMRNLPQAVHKLAQTIRELQSD